MKGLVIRQASRFLRGEVFLPGDKSIAHRAVIISSLSRVKTSILNFPASDDCLATVAIFKKLGIPIFYNRKTSTVIVCGRGLKGLGKPKGNLYIAESGTTFRMLLGVLAGQDFPATITAGKSLSIRPMRRVTAPLRLMGAQIHSILNTQYSIQEEYPPITIKGGNLRGITYRMPVASAQVKSAILLAGLNAPGQTKIIELVTSRDHTERMLRLFKANIIKSGKTIRIRGDKELISPKKIVVPGDISSAAFFMVLGCILPRAAITLKNVGLNPTRTGILKVLKRMGAVIRLNPYPLSRTPYEPVGDIDVRSSILKGTIVRKQEIPSLIDELPILMVAAACAKGKTMFEGVGELRVKETDRIRSMSENLRKMGVRISIVKKGALEDILIEGAKELRGAKVRSFGDHRTAMSLVVAAVKAVGQTSIDDVSCINKSFPDFIRITKSLIR